MHDLLAHLAGSSTDLVTRNVDGVATEPWSARQVDDRRDRPAVELVAGRETNVDEVADLCIRMFLSVVQFDSEATRSDDALRGYLRRRLVPVLDLPGA